MMRRQGFTLVELMIAMIIGAVLTGMVVFLFIACFRSWDAGEVRTKLRTEMSQAMELMVKDLQHALVISEIQADRIIFQMFQKDIKVDYWFYLDSIDGKTSRLHRSLAGEDGPVIVSGLASKDVFSTKDGRLVTIDLAGARGSATLHMRTNVMLRNL